MLPARSRMRRSTDFREVVRRGRRAGSPLLVVHLLGSALEDDAPDQQVISDVGPAPVLAGLVVSRAVGGAVVRTTVKRRLRHLLAERVPGLPAGTRVVVRAAPGAAVASSAELGVELDRDLRAALRPRSAAPGPRSAAPGAGPAGRPPVRPDQPRGHRPGGAR